MLKVFEIYGWICTIIASVIIIAGLIAVLLNVIAYFYETWVGFDTFKKFLRKYHSEMKTEKDLKKSRRTRLCQKIYKKQ